MQKHRNRTESQKCLLLRANKCLLLISLLSLDDKSGDNSTTNRHYIFTGNYPTIAKMVKKGTKIYELLL